MKKFFVIFLAFIASAVGANAQYTTGTNQSTYGSVTTVTNANSTWVNGYTKKDGTHVDGYYRTKRNGTNHDNYSTSGNYNPYSGSEGSRAKDYSSDAYNYGGGRTIHTGSRGGQYYINKNGNKTYVPKRR